MTALMSVAKPPRTLPELLALHERLIIVRTLAENEFSRTRAAGALGISRVDLWRRMRRLHIDNVAAPRTSAGRPRKKNGT